jgi:cysteinyl-tRNA synthetase
LPSAILGCGFPVVQAKDKARKDLEKVRKVREPLTKKLAEDPDALGKLAADVQQLQQELETMSVDVGSTA